jgi:hypothetical protein
MTGAGHSNLFFAVICIFKGIVFGPLVVSEAETTAGQHISRGGK